MVNKSLLEELQKIVQEEYGIALKFDEVSDIGNSLVAFFELLVEINNKK